MKKMRKIAIIYSFKTNITRFTARTPQL